MLSSAKPEAQAARLEEDNDSRATVNDVAITPTVTNDCKAIDTAGTESGSKTKVNCQDFTSLTTEQDRVSG